MLLTKGRSDILIGKLLTTKPKTNPVITPDSSRTTGVTPESQNDIPNFTTHTKKKKSLSYNSDPLCQGINSNPQKKKKKNVSP